MKITIEELIAEGFEKMNEKPVGIEDTNRIILNIKKEYDSLVTKKVKEGNKINYYDVYVKYGDEQ